MLVIADQRAVRVGGEGGLAGAGQAEEDGGVALRPDIGGTVHRHDLLFHRQQVIEDGEDPLLDLAGIARAADDDHPAGEIDNDEGLGIGAVDRWEGVKVGHVDDGKPGCVVLQFLLRRIDEHVAGEQGVPGLLGDDPDRQPVLRVGAGKTVLHEQVAALHVGAHPFVERVEQCRVEGPIDLAPSDVVVAGRLVDDEFLVGGPTGVMSGLDRDGAEVGNQAFAALDDLLVEHRCRRRPVDQVGIGDAMRFEPRASGDVVQPHCLAPPL